MTTRMRTFISQSPNRNFNFKFYILESTCWTYIDFLLPFFVGHEINRQVAVTSLNEDTYNIWRQPTLTLDKNFMLARV